MNINYLLIINDDITKDRSTTINGFFKKRDIVLDSVKLYKCYRINGPLVNTFVSEEAKCGIYHVFKDDASYRDYMRFKSLMSVFSDYAFNHPIKFIGLDMCNNSLTTPTIKQVGVLDANIKETRIYDFNNLDLLYSISHEMVAFYEKYEKIRSEMSKDIMYTIIRDPYSSITLVPDSFESDDVIVSGNLYSKGV